MELYVIVLRCVFSEKVIQILRCQNFNKKLRANEFVKRTEAEIELNPDKMLNLKEEIKQATLAECIKWYPDEVDSFAWTKTGALNHIASLEISEKNIYSLTR